MKKLYINRLLICFVFCLMIQSECMGQNTNLQSNQKSALTGTASEKISMVLDITVHDSLQYQQYRMKVEPLIEKYGGIYLVRSGGMAFDPNPDRKVIPVEGNWNPNRFIIVQWDSMEQLRKFEEIQPLQNRLL